MNKKIFLGLCLTFLAAYSAIGQKKELIVNGNDTVMTLLPEEYIYWLPRFSEGTVFFKSKEIGKGLINYNLLAKKMQFITNPEYSKINATDVKLSEIRDLVVTDVKFISVDNLIFVNTNKGIMLQVTDFPINLLKKVEVTQSENVPKGAYGIPISTGAASSPTSLSDLPSSSSAASPGGDNPSNVTGRNNLPQSGSDINRFGENKEFKKTTNFYLTDNSKTIQINSAKPFYKLFSSKVEEIKAYVEREKVDFNSEEDLVALTKYCNSLK
jgi:hypothetical protein